MYSLKITSHMPILSYCKSMVSKWKVYSIRISLYLQIYKNRKSVIFHKFIGSASKASGSLMTVTCKFFAEIRLSFLHLGQYNGKLIKIVLGLILFLVLFPHMGHIIHSSFISNLPITRTQITFYRAFNNSQLFLTAIYLCHYTIGQNADR